MNSIWSNNYNKNYWIAMNFTRINTDIAPSVIVQCTHIYSFHLCCPNEDKSWHKLCIISREWYTGVGSWINESPGFHSVQCNGRTWGNNLKMWGNLVQVRQALGQVLVCSWLKQPCTYSLSYNRTVQTDEYLGMTTSWHSQSSRKKLSTFAQDHWPQISHACYCSQQCRTQK